MKSRYLCQLKLSRRQSLQVMGVFGGIVGAKIVGCARPSIDSQLSQLLAPETFLDDSRVEFNVVKVNVQGAIIQVERQQNEYYREDLGDGIFLDLMNIPGGSFIKDFDKHRRRRYSNERADSSEDSQRVSLKPFWMGKYTVTQWQWQAIANDVANKIERDLPDNPSRFKGDDLPADSIRWYDAVEFCQRLSAKTGRDYRLPTDSEWEYACRAGTTAPFHFGETITTDIVNYDGRYPDDGQPQDIGRDRTTEVGSFNVANSYGLYDMHGNLWEWCLLDDYGEPQKSCANDASQTDDDGVLLCWRGRGGSWLNGPSLCGSAVSATPGGPKVHLDDGLDIHGFRIVCSST